MLNGISCTYLTEVVLYVRDHRELDGQLNCCWKKLIFHSANAKLGGRVTRQMSSQMLQISLIISQNTSGKSEIMKVVRRVISSSGNVS